MLTALWGEHKQVNRTLLLKSFDNTPCLILDCGNASDVHALFPQIKEKQLHDVYVINLEAIYRFRRGLQETPYWIKKLNIKQIVITTVHVLFSYDNDVENYNVLEQCWEIMKTISKCCPVKVGIAKDSMHEAFAKRFADTIEKVREVDVSYYHSPNYMRH